MLGMTPGAVRVGLRVASRRRVAVYLPLKEVCCSELKSEGRETRGGGSICSGKSTPRFAIASPSPCLSWTGRASSYILPLIHKAQTSSIGKTEQPRVHENFNSDRFRVLSQQLWTPSPTYARLNDYVHMVLDETMAKGRRHPDVRLLCTVLVPEGSSILVSFPFSSGYI